MKNFVTLATGAAGLVWLTAVASITAPHGLLLQIMPELWGLLPVPGRGVLDFRPRPT